MKAGLVTVLQTRMDKCTTEQFWMVMAVTGVNGLIITNPAEIQAMGVHSVVLVVVLALAAVGAFLFVLTRHLMFFKLRATQLDLLYTDEELNAYFDKYGRPMYLRRHGRGVNSYGITGLGMYSAWIFFGTMGAIWSVV